MHGALIAPSIVLTAAHCLYNPRTRALLQAVSLHVLFGYQRGVYLWHRQVARAMTGPGFDGTIGGPQPGDWARLELATDGTIKSVAFKALSPVEAQKKIERSAPQHELAVGSW